ncbi:hypothetical protein M378DRAFT_571490 [Amanita muscaria Koide BX008]|uniref:Uncharacterized protein n=1 Tax=Amanita muscaria (strain Koide BX008) TaxID=946122 RepID=A0A0C2X7H1_AMAMK|nr:hypothetical protein M378DRAFT_571490 [Amanita muscaria Koide BX008]
MRLSTVFISSTFVLAGTSAAFPVEAEDMLVARFADPDFLSEVEARAYDEEPELYVHGGAISTNNYKTLSRHRRSFHESPRYELTRRNLPGSWPVENSEPRQQRVTFALDNNDPPRRSSSSVRPPTPPESPRNGFRASISNMFRTTGSLFNKFRNRRSFDELPQSELTRRHEWEPVPDSPRVHWTSDTVDPPTRPRRPLTPAPNRPQPPSSPNGNGWHPQRHHPRSFFDLD